MADTAGSAGRGVRAAARRAGERRRADAAGLLPRPPASRRLAGGELHGLPAAAAARPGRPVQPTPGNGVRCCKPKLYQVFILMPYYCTTQPKPKLGHALHAHHPLASAKAKLLDFETA